MLARISRILVGALFIVSGLIKANDPMGFSYKLNDYFAPGVLNMTWLDPIALELSVFICVAEIVLGIAILFGARMRLASWSLLLLMIFFTFLTGYTAIANWMFDNEQASFTAMMEGMFGFVIREDYSYMKDCGCFGDAIKLDPWESFLKDVVLMIFTVIIFIKRKTIEPADLKTDLINLGIALILVAGFSFGVLGWGFPVWFSIVSFGVLLALKQFIKNPAVDWIMAGAATVLCTWFSVHCVMHLPVKDFRPYRIGNNIAELKECPPDAPQDVYEDTWFYSVNGEVKEYTTAEAPWNIEGAEFVDRETVLISKGCEPPIHDFVLEAEDGTDMTDAILEEEYVILVITYDVTKANEDVQQDLNAIYDASNDDGGPYIYGLCANSYNDLEDYRHKHNVMYDYLTADGTMLKTIIRSNPALVLLNQGTVIGKWHHNDLPSYEDLKAELLP